MIRRTLRYLAALVLLVLVLAPVILISTDTGTRWMVGVADSRLPVQLDGVQGSLRSGLALDRLIYHDQQRRVELTGLTLQLRLGCALRSVLCISRAHIDAVEIALAPAKQPATLKALRAPLPWLPLAMEVDTLSVAELNIDTGSSQEQLRSLQVSLNVTDRTALIESLSLVHRTGELRGGALLARSGDWEVALTLLPDKSVADRVPPSLMRPFELTASGDLAALRAELKPAAGGEPALSVEVDLPGADTPLALRGSLAGLTDIVPALADQRWAQTRGALLFDARREGPVSTLRLRQRLDGYAPAPVWLELNLRERDRLWTLTRGTLGDPAAPLLDAVGTLGDLAAAAPQLEIRSTGFTPPLGPEVPALSVSGSTALAFRADEVLDSWQLRKARLEIREGDNAWKVAGELAASEVRLLPSGALRGSRNGTPFEYRRAAERGSAALLSLPEGLQSGELAMSALRAEVLPDDWTRASVEAEGDLRGQLDVQLQRGDDGVRFKLEPFVVFLRDEAISSDASIAGMWSQSRSKIVLGALCLQWRANRACADQAQLGQSGDIQLALSVDEEYQNAASGKPFSMRARGAGQLDLRWRDAALEEALIAVDFDTLSLDPFMEEGTALPIVWEEAAARARIVPGLKELALDLNSRRLGTLQLDVSESDAGLAGSLQAGGLNVAALDDLLPEWTLRSGSIDADLRIKGTREAPQLLGTVVLDGAAADLPEVDSMLSDVHIEVEALGKSVAIDGSGLLGDAPLFFTGECCDDGALAGRLRGERNRLRLPVGVDALVSPDLALRLTADSLGVSGELTVHEGVLEHAGPTEEGIPVSADIRRIDTPVPRPRRFGIAATLRTLIEPGFVVRSRELKATVSGDLRLAVQPGVPTSLYGDLQVLGGELRAYGQSLRLTRGSVGFVGDPLNPALNLSAERRINAEDLRVGFRVRGSLEEPLFELFSDPVRPERDMLSYLLRGRGPDAGSAVDGTAMALSLGASAINQSGALESLNAIPGLSGVTLGAEGTDEEMAATISAYVGERLYLSYGVGIYEPINALTARLYLRSRLWIEVVSRLESSFDLYYRFDID